MTLAPYPPSNDDHRPSMHEAVPVSNVDDADSEKKLDDSGEVLHPIFSVCEDVMDETIQRMRSPIESLGLLRTEEEEKLFTLRHTRLLVLAVKSNANLFEANGSFEEVMLKLHSYAQTEAEKLLKKIVEERKQQTMSDSVIPE